MAVELAEEIFHAPVRLASPQFVVGLDDVVNNPIHATGVGLLHYALLRTESENLPEVSYRKDSLRAEADADGFAVKIKRWFSQF